LNSFYFLPLGHMSNIYYTRKFATSISMAVITSLLFMGCQVRPSGSNFKKVSKKNTIRIAISEDVTEFSFSHDYESPVPLFNLIYDPLLWDDFSKQGSTQNIAMESMKVSPDGKSCLVNLRKGMLYHDGSEIVSKDVYQLIRPVEGMHSPKGFWANLQFEELGKYSFRLTNPHAIDWSYILKSVRFIKNGTGRGGWGDDDFMPRVGSGPYMYQGYDEKERIIKLKRWDKYWAGPAKYKYAELHLFSGTDGPLFNLLAGRVDYFNDMTSEDVKLVKRNNDLHVVEYWMPALAKLVFGKNSNVFSDWRIRKAVSLLINRKELVFSDKTLEGNAIPTDTSFNLLSPVNEPELVDGFDPARAARLLEEAGLKRNPSNGRLTLDGKEFMINFVNLSKGEGKNYAVVRMIVSSLNEAGIGCNMRKFVASQEDIKMIENLQAPVIYFECKMDFQPDVTLGILADICSYSDKNLLCFGDKDLDERYARLIDLKMKLAPKEDIAEAKKSLQKLYLERAYIVPLFYPKSFAAYMRLEDDEKKMISMDPWGLTYHARPGLPQ